jgi:hypothetical protein
MKKSRTLPRSENTPGSESSDAPPAMRPETRAEVISSTAGGKPMDPRTVEINSLRILNDYLNQTIEAMVRAQRVGLGQFSATGLSHSPFAGVSPFGASPFTGFEHTQGFGPYVGQSQFGVGGQIPSYATMIDPFLAQRGLSHTTLGTPWAGTYNPLVEIARQQQELVRQRELQALALRNWGVPV